MSTNRRALALVVLAQFGATSTWFSHAAGARSLATETGWNAAQVGALGTATQFGFAAATLVLAWRGTVDRVPLPRLFALGALLAAACNAGLWVASDSFAAALALRAAVGLCLAAVYPVGMRMAMQLAGDRAPAAVAWLVATLTLGTGAPNLALALGRTPEWRVAVGVASALAVAAAVAMLGVRIPEGTRAAAALPPPGAVIPQLVRTPAFRVAVGAYLGHMWELYPFWALVPLLAGSPAIAFAVFAVGALACGLGGGVALRIGPRRLAALAMATSCGAAIAYPLAVGIAPWLAAAALVAWGAAVIPDSPHLSVLAARAAPEGTAGSALALSTSLGFALTAIGILGASALLPMLGAKVAWVLAVGPALGLLGLRPRREG